MSTRQVNLNTTTRSTRPTDSNKAMSMFSDVKELKKIENENNKTNKNKPKEYNINVENLNLKTVGSLKNYSPDSIRINNNININNNNSNVSNLKPNINIRPAESNIYKSIGKPLDERSSYENYLFQNKQSKLLI